MHIRAVIPGFFFSFPLLVVLASVLPIEVPASLVASVVLLFLQIL
jgi:hypothetical protein